MALSEAQCRRLFDELEKIGWCRRNDSLYAPQATMWLSLSTPWTGDLQDFHERMHGRLERVVKMCSHAAVDDVRGLVQVLDMMLSDEPEGFKDR
jgi:hypothetical protein